MEKIIRYGNSNILVDTIGNMARSFTGYGEFISEVDADSVLKLYRPFTSDTHLISFLSTGKHSKMDVMFDGKHCLVSLDKPMSTFIIQIKNSLPLLSYLAYRMNSPEAGVLHTVFALKPETTIEYISRLLNIPIEQWEPVIGG